MNVIVHADESKIGRVFREASSTSRRNQVRPKERWTRTYSNNCIKQNLLLRLKRQRNLRRS